MKNWSFLIAIIIIVGCSSETKFNTPSVNDLADTYLSRFIETYPEFTYFIELPLENHSGISSNTLDDIKLWENFEDSIYTQLCLIDEASIKEKVDKVTYWTLKEILESNRSMRICKRDLWNVNPLYGWQVIWTYIANFQPVGSDELREQALERWGKFPTYIDIEIDNLKTGISNGYTMPKEIVTLVIEQLQAFQDYGTEGSPYMSPAIRDTNEIFQSKWTALIEEKINPSISKYQQFLKDEYFEAARDRVSILALPNGNECYQAYIRMETTTDKTGKEIYDLGKQIVAENKKKVISIGSEIYQTTDFREIIEQIDKDSANYFQTEDEILEFCNILLSEAKEECNNWFAILPSTECTIKPYEAYEMGIGGYEPSWGDNPPFFRINLSNPGTQKKSQNEILVFHEVYPGHHLQIGIEKDLEGLHPITNLVTAGSYVEGWARYSEQLAEEMGLYRSKIAMINRRAWPARGMVVDPGVHLYNWTKEEAISFMMESGWNEDVALSVYQRIIVMPAQLTSYDVGGEEIKALRKLAENNINQNFDIKEFHSKILENGKLPLNALRGVIEEWIEEKTK